VQRKQLFADGAHGWETALRADKERKESLGVTTHGGD
jgi:hypothetical protein